MGMRCNFNENWKFIRGNYEPLDETSGWGGAKCGAADFGMAGINCKDDGFRTVTLPHDFVLEGDYIRKNNISAEMSSIPEMESIDSRLLAGGSLEGDIAWYRKHFMVEKEMEGKKLWLHFGGIYRNSTVYLNHFFIGHHKNGYSSFSYDITDFVTYGQENILAVRVDAAGREGWWYEGGGIYRNVYLEIKEPVYAENDSLFIKPYDIDVNNKTGSFSIDAVIRNDLYHSVQVIQEYRIYDKEMRLAKTFHGPEISCPAFSSIPTHESRTMENIHLWSTEDPYLYKLEMILHITSDDSAVQSPPESETISFGFRTAHFDADKGFYLNGRHLKIKGFCLHQDHAGVGIGAAKEIMRFRLKQLKELGTNAVRSAHHQAADELLELCDELGLLMFDETRRMGSNPEDLEELITLVKKDRNHPCVFLRGIGNEEVFVQDREQVPKIAEHMKAVIYSLDDSRPVTAAIVCWNGIERFKDARRFIPFAKKLDVMGFNYNHGAWDDFHEAVPLQPVIITEETTNSGTRGCYETAEENSQYYIFDSENERKCKSGNKAVKMNMGEGAWSFAAEREYISGLFLWTGIDYRGEPTPLSYPAVSSQFGVLDTCGFRKDNAYYYQSWWTQDPVLHIFPHWNLHGKEGLRIPVYCYSNLDEVELFVNNRSQGRQKMKRNWYLCWDKVIYEPGELKAVGYRNGRIVKEEIVRTAGVPYQLKLSCPEEIREDDRIIILKAEVLDRDGWFVPTADPEIHIHVNQGGTLLGTGNGNPGSHESDLIPVRRAFHGLCEILIRRDFTGPVIVSAAAEGLMGDTFQYTALKCEEKKNGK